MKQKEYNKKKSKFFSLYIGVFHMKTNRNKLIVLSLGLLVSMPAVQAMADNMGREFMQRLAERNARVTAQQNNEQAAPAVAPAPVVALLAEQQVDAPAALVAEQPAQEPVVDVAAPADQAPVVQPAPVVPAPVVEPVVVAEQQAAVPVADAPAAPADQAPATSATVDATVAAPAVTEAQPGFIGRIGNGLRAAGRTTQAGIVATGSAVRTAAVATGNAARTAGTRVAGVFRSAPAQDTLVAEQQVAVPADQAAPAAQAPVEAPAVAQNTEATVAPSLRQRAATMLTNVGQQVAAHPYMTAGATLATAVSAAAAYMALNRNTVPTITLENGTQLLPTATITVALKDSNQFQLFLFANGEFLTSNEDATAAIQAAFDASASKPNHKAEATLHFGNNDATLRLLLQRQAGNVIRVTVARKNDEGKLKIANVQQQVGNEVTRVSLRAYVGPDAAMTEQMRSVNNAEVLAVIGQLSRNEQIQFQAAPAQTEAPVAGPADARQ